MRNGKLAATDYSRLVLYTEFRRKKPAFHPVLYERRERIRRQLVLKFECHGFVFEITSKRHKTVYGCHFLFVRSGPAQSYRTRRRYAHKRENVTGFLRPIISDEKPANHASGNSLESQGERLLKRTERPECLRTGSWVIFQRKGTYGTMR